MNKLYINTALFVSVFLPIAVSAKSIPVPFTSQAPYGNWSEPWNNACEETSVAMVDAYYQKKTFTPPIAKQRILDVLNIKQKEFGWSLDENAAKIASLINNYFPWEASVRTNPTIEMVQGELDAGRPVIIPVYGKELKNKNFRNGGPVYHMLVVSGYDDEKKEFITQEPGTRHGLDFRYPYDTLMNAIHDYLPKGQTKNGPGAAIFTSPDIVDSGETDADHDGLSKTDEITYGTSLMKKDTDGDGYSDGVEVQSGHSPTKK